MQSAPDAEFRKELILAAALFHTQPPRGRIYANSFRVLRHALMAAGLWDERQQGRYSAAFHGVSDDPLISTWYATLIELTRAEPASGRLLEGGGDLDLPAGAYFTGCWLTPAGEAVAERLLAEHPDWAERLA